MSRRICVCWLTLPGRRRGSGQILSGALLKTPFLRFLAVFSGFLSILISFLTSCELRLPRVTHLSAAFYVVKSKVSPEQLRRGFAVFPAANFSA